MLIHSLTYLLSFLGELAIKSIGITLFEFKLLLQHEGLKRKSHLRFSSFFMSLYNKIVLEVTNRFTSKTNIVFNIKMSYLN